MRRDTAILLTLMLAAVVGCDKEKAKRELNSAASQAAAAYEEAKVLAQARDFLKAVEARDLPALKKLSTDAECPEFGAIADGYYNAFVLENDKGPDAARSYLAQEIARSDNPPAKQKALAALHEYFKAKGSLRTKEAAALVLIIGLEIKYPHEGGKVGKLLAEKLGLIDATSQPGIGSKDE